MTNNHNTPESYDFKPKKRKYSVARAGGDAYGSGLKYEDRQKYLRVSGREKGDSYGDKQVRDYCSGNVRGDVEKYSTGNSLGYLGNSGAWDSLFWHFRKGDDGTSGYDVPVN